MVTGHQLGIVSELKSEIAAAIRAPTTIRTESQDRKESVMSTTTSCLAAWIRGNRRTNPLSEDLVRQIFGEVVDHGAQVGAHQSQGGYNNNRDQTSNQGVFNRCHTGIVFP